jgi:Domain of unknown function (DUF4404)
MEPNSLRDHLGKLHEELTQVSSVDPQSSQLLGELMNDIKRLMQSPTPDAVAAPDTNASLPDRLEKIAVQFEVDHPTLAASSRRLVDILGKVGL